jgi:menaquinone-dependent protoporphyrinogen IX oxidase
MRVLILFSSFDGQTGRIARRVGEAFTAAGHAVAFRSVDEPEAGEDIERQDAVVVGGAIR